MKDDISQGNVLKRLEMSPMSADFSPLSPVCLECHQSARKERRHEHLEGTSVLEKTLYE
jgi:hypothetical protein